MLDAKTAPADTDNVLSVDAAADRELRDKLIVTIVDKGLFAIVALLIGFWLNKALDSVKADNSLRAELAKIRDSRNLEYREKQLSEFYWPLYVRLQYDNAVWSRILDQKQGNDELPQKLGKEIEENFVLPNHEQMLMIITSKMHLMEDDDIALQAMLDYIRHVALYKAMRLAGIKDRFPDELGEPWPRQLFPRIEDMAYKLQHEYEVALRDAGVAEPRSRPTKSLKRTPDGTA
jgi:hypothetical protein